MKSIQIVVFMLLTGFFAVSHAPGQISGRPSYQRTIQTDDDRVAQHGFDADAREAVPAPTRYMRPDSKDRFNYYVKSMFGPMALGKTVLSAG